MATKSRFSRPLPVVKIRVELLTQAFDPFARVQAFSSSYLKPGRYGANAIFIGNMRDFNDGRDVDQMLLEHYPGMTERQLEAIVSETCVEFSIDEAYVAHRVGVIRVGEPIVVTAVWAAHRKAAFEACRYLMEGLKSRAPFWKREHHGSATHWVEKNTAGY